MEKETYISLKGTKLIRFKPKKLPNSSILDSREFREMTKEEIKNDK